MSVNLRIALGTFVTIGVLGGLLFYLFRTNPDEGPPPEDRLAERLERTSVHFHMALRERVATGGSTFAARVRQAGDDRREADAVARLVFDDLDEAHPSERSAPVLVHFGGGELSSARDRFHIVMAMLWSERHPAKEDRIPLYALLHEARGLEPSQLDASYAGLAMAAKAFVHASGGYCDLVEPMIDEATAEVPTSQMAAWIDDDDDPAAAAVTLGRLQRLLVDGSLACCAMRSEGFEETAARLERSIADAEALGVCEKRLPMLRAWVALLRGRRDEARRELQTVAVSELHEDDRESHRIIRSALATQGEGAPGRALVGTSRVDWLSRLVVAGVLEAVEDSPLAPVLRTGEPARAAEELVRGEAAVIDAARRIDPFFEQGRMSDVGARRSAPVPAVLRGLEGWR